MFLKFRVVLITATVTSSTNVASQYDSDVVPIVQTAEQPLAMGEPGDGYPSQ